MQLRELVLAAPAQVLRDEEGGELRAALQPVASPARLAEIEADLGFALPAELRELLELTAGLDFDPYDSLDFASIGPCPLEGLFGPLLSVTGDGAGNFWIVELCPGQKRLGPVWFLCHDAPVLVYQCADLASFLADYLTALEGRGGPVHEMQQRCVRAVWTQTKDLPRAALLDSPDPVLSNFAQSLAEGWFVRDLRRAQFGDGMPLGRFGPRTPLARAGQEFVFAYGSRTRLQRLSTWITGR